MDIAGEIEPRIKDVLTRIERAAERSGRKAGDVKLVAVTKSRTAEELQAAIEILGRTGSPVIIGENYVQEFAAKRERLEGSFSSHLIGHLQRNKAKQAITLFDCIESVDSPQLLAALEKEANRAQRSLEFLLQVNISRDPKKSGILPDAVAAFVREQLPKTRHLKCAGLMTITEFYEEPEQARGDFRALRELASALKSGTETAALLPERIELSMGMSADFEVAIEEGATLVRVGTALFGPRA